MLVLISEVISNSNAVIRQDFRKLRFLKFPTYLSSLVLLVHLSALVVHRALIVGICFRRAARLPLPPKKQARPNR